MRRLGTFLSLMIIGLTAHSSIHYDKNLLFSAPGLSGLPAPLVEEILAHDLQEERLWLLEEAIGINTWESDTYLEPELEVERLNNLPPELRQITCHIFSEKVQDEGFALRYGPGSVQAYQWIVAQACSINTQ